MDKLFGVFKAIVTDTECFKETGMIKTRISALNDYYVSKDLRDSYDINKFKESLEEDSYTQIFIPFGGGYDNGMFKLPPINSLGLVSFIDGKYDSPIWMGGIPNNTYTRAGALYENNSPSDNLVSGKSIITYNESENNAEFNNEDLNSFVIKTKSNELNDLTNPEEMNWESRPVENGIVLNKNRMEFAHFKEEGKAQKILLAEKIEDGDSDYSIKITDENNDLENSTILIGNSGIKIEIQKGDFLSNIIVSEGSIELKTKKDNQETKISQTEKEIRLDNDKSSVILKKDGLNDEIILNSTKVRISSNDILLGNGDYRVVISPANFNLTMEDGTMLTTAKNVRI